MDRWAAWDSTWLRVLLIILTVSAMWTIVLFALEPGSDFAEVFLLPAFAFIGMVALPIGTYALMGNRRLLMLFGVLYIFFSAAVWRNRDFSDTSLDFQVLIQLAFWAYGGLLGFLHLPVIAKKMNDYLVITVLVMMAVIVVSPFWSPNFTYSMFSAALNVMFLLFALTLVYKLEERELVWVMTFATLMLVVPSLAMSPFQNSFAEVTGEGTGAEDRLRGMTGHPIGLALVCSILMLCSVAIFINNWGSRVLPIAFFAMAVATIALTQSRTPLVGALFACMAVPAYRFRILGRASGLIFILIGILAVTVIVSGLEYIIPEDFLANFSRSGEVREILSLTGRGEIWNFTLGKIAERPLLGWGVGSGADVILPNYTDPTMNIMHAHNALLHFTLSTGVIGGMLLATVFCMMLYRSFKYGSVFTSTLVVMLMVAGITEAVYMNNRPNMMTFFLYAAVGLCTLAVPKP
ncbi:MAG: O-antigen ligase family protein, partial [Pseudomonadota bacterium]